MFSVVSVAFSVSVVFFDRIHMGVRMSAKPKADDQRVLTVVAANRKSVLGTSGMAMARE